MDFTGTKTTVSSKGTDYPNNCTPDGKWVIYRDRQSAREYRDRYGNIPENTVDDGAGWHGFIEDMYRYEIATGKSQKFAVVRDDSTALVSPDGLKVLLGNRHDSGIEMPEPKWEAVWFTNDWTNLETFWLPDSSGVVTRLWGNGSSLGVEFFGPDAWAKEFSLEMLSSRPFPDVTLEAVDKTNGLLFITYLSEGKSKVYNFFKCKIKHKDLVCDLTGGHEEKDRVISFDLLPNQDVIFKREDDNCIRRIKYRKPSECVADTRYGNETYIGIDLIGISPDGRWMAFRRSKMPPPGKRFYAYQYDLFVKKISDE